MVVLKGAIKTHSYVRFDQLRYARRVGGVLVAVAAARCAARGGGQDASFIYSCSISYI